MRELVVIGGSAGALEALLEILPALPDTFETPILIVVHLSPELPSHLAEVLGKRCSRAVCEATHGGLIHQGTIYVAPPDHHLLVDPAGICLLSMAPPVHFSRPSIDVLFESAAAAFGYGVTGVILSGANDDGARGLQEIFTAGGTAIIQSPSAAPQPAMPSAALHHVRDAYVLAVDQIASFLARRASRKATAS